MSSAHPTRDIIAIGASDGGFEALQVLAGGLPADLPAAVFVILHITAHSTGMLATLLARAGPLPAVSPADGTPIETGRIYVAPPDRHLLRERGRVLRWLMVAVIAAR